MYTVSSAPDLSSRLGPSQPGELGGGAKARHRRLASRTLTASQGNAAKPGGRARRPCLRQTPLVELYSGEPALTRDVRGVAAPRSYGRLRNSTTL